MDAFKPKAVEKLREQYPKAIEKIYLHNPKQPSPHSWEDLPTVHIFEFETGLQLCLTAEQMPTMVLPTMVLPTMQRYGMLKHLEPGQKILHVSGSWAEGYKQPETEEEAYKQMRNAVEVLRGYEEDEVFGFIERSGFPHLVFHLTPPKKSPILSPHRLNGRHGS